MLLKAPLAFLLTILHLAAATYLRTHEHRDTNSLNSSHCHDVDSRLPENWQCPLPEFKHCVGIRMSDSKTAICCNIGYTCSRLPPQSCSFDQEDFAKRYFFDTGAAGMIHCPDHDEICCPVGYTCSKAGKDGIEIAHCKTPNSTVFLQTAMNGISATEICEHECKLNFPDSMISPDVVPRSRKRVL